MSKKNALTELRAKTKHLHELVNIIRDGVSVMRAEGKSDIEIQAQIMLQIMNMPLGVNSLTSLVGIMALQLRSTDGGFAE